MVRYVNVIKMARVVNSEYGYMVYLYKASNCVSNAIFNPLALTTLIYFCINHSDKSCFFSI